MLWMKIKLNIYFSILFMYEAGKKAQYIVRYTTLLTIEGSWDAVVMVVMFAAAGVERGLLSYLLII